MAGSRVTARVTVRAAREDDLDAVVENVIVAPDRRRDGVGRALMDEVERRSRDAGCYRIQLLSANPRAEAHAFYEARGYKRSAQGFRRYL